MQTLLKDKVTFLIKAWGCLHRKNYSTPFQIKVEILMINLREVSAYVCIYVGDNLKVCERA